MLCSSYVRSWLLTTLGLRTHSILGKFLIMPSNVSLLDLCRRGAGVFVARLNPRLGSGYVRLEVCARRERGLGPGCPLLPVWSMDHFGRSDFVEPHTELQKLRLWKLTSRFYNFFSVLMMRVSLNKPLTCKQCAVQLNIFPWWSYWIATFLACMVTHTNKIWL